MKLICASAVMFFLQK